MNTTGGRTAGPGELEDRGKVRRARPEDVAAMVALEKQAPELAHWSEQMYRAAFESVHPKRIMLVGETRGALESFLVARFTGAECELESLLVRSGSRRRGIATRLLNSLVETMRERGAGKIFLEVRESNCAARAFYLKLGFSQTGLRKAYYRNPSEDAVVYSMDI